MVKYRKRVAKKTKTDSEETGILGYGILNVRDAAHIAKLLAQGKANSLPKSADYINDGKINVRNVAAIAKFLASSNK